MIQLTRKSPSTQLAVTDGFLLLALVAIACCTFAALFAARHWPLVGDASLMRYVVFLLRSGHAPYSQIIDINLPGSYFLEASAMRIFGGGAVGLRLYDAALSAVICASAVTLSKRGLRARACALIGGLLIILVHLRDGLVQAGERDYAILAMALLAFVFLLRVSPAWRLAGTCVFGFLAGCTMTVKPTMVLLVLVPVYAAILQHDQPRDVIKKSGGAMVGFVLPLVGTFLWLRAWHAIPAFLNSMELLRRSHSGLAHQSVVFLLVHSVQPVALLALMGVGLLLMRGFRLDVEQKLLLCGAMAGFGSFVMQGKGFSYQRYPFLGLMIVVLFGLLAEELGGRSTNHALAAAALTVSCLWWAPRFALGVAGYDHNEPFEEALSQDLTALGAGTGDVQCFDTVGGCVNVLYDKHLIQGTGYLYDCYAYSGPDDERAAYRRGFLAAVEAARPRYIVLTSEFCLSAQGRSERISEWPAMGDYIHQNYTQTASWHTGQSLHWWHEPEVPPSFEILARK